MAATSAGERAEARSVLRLPWGTDADPERMRAGLVRYAEARTADLTLRRAALRREGMQTPWLALAFVAVCAAAAPAVEFFVREGLVATLLGDGVVIAGWVAG